MRNFFFTQWTQAIVEKYECHIDRLPLINFINVAVYENYS
jgi:hypothetical protein